MKKTSRSGGFWFVWGMPIFLAVLTMFGLLAALLATGVWHWLSWFALATPIAVCLWYGLRRKSG